jgi:threonyl-tRNA synthetase
MLVTGDREAAEGTVAVRHRSAGDLGARTLEAFLDAALDEVRTKDLSGPSASPTAEKQPA